MGVEQRLLFEPAADRINHCGRVAQLAEQCPFKAWVDGSSPSALTTNPLELVDLHSGTFSSQKILTLTRPTTCEPSHLNVVGFIRDLPVPLCLTLPELGRSSRSCHVVDFASGAYLTLLHLEA
jgi:hypothetical protein